MKANLLGGTHLVVAGMASASKVHHLVLTVNQLVDADKLGQPEGGALLTLDFTRCQMLLDPLHDEQLVVELAHAHVFSSFIWHRGCGAGRLIAPGCRCCWTHTMMSHCWWSLYMHMC